MQSPAYYVTHNLTILAGYANGKITHGVFVEKKPAMKIYQYAYTAKGYLSLDKSMDIEFLKGVADKLKKDKCILWQIELPEELKEYDINGSEVEGGFDNSQCIRDMEDAGFHWMDLGQGSNTNHQMTWQSVIDINGDSYETIEANMKKAGRRHIRKCIKAGYECILYKPSEMTEALWNETEHLLQLSADYQHFDVGSASKRKAMAKAFGDDGCRIAVVYDENRKAIYTGVFYSTPYEVIYLASGMDRESTKLAPAYLAQSEMIKYTINIGASRYNFGGISGYFEKGQEGYGVFEFKRNLGAKVIRSMGPFNKVLSMPGKLFESRVL